MNRIYFFAAILAFAVAAQATTMQTRLAKGASLCEGALKILQLEGEIREYMGTFYRERMRNQGVTQEKMGSYLGVNKSAVNHILSGRTIPNFRTLMIMADVLGLSQKEAFPPGWIKESSSSKKSKKDEVKIEKAYVNEELLKRVFNVIKQVEVEPELRSHIMKLSIEVASRELKNDNSVSDEKITIAILTTLYRSTYTNPHSL
jgi:transcriptional regulator with XRE-family HTH domain